MSRIELEITHLGALGDGIGMHEGTEVFAPFTLPGERVAGDLSGDRIAKPSIMEPSPERVSAPCRHFRTCGGCAMQHMAEPARRRWKEDSVRQTLERAGLKPEFLPMHVSAPHTRRRATFAARRGKNGAMTGFHARASDTIVPITECHLLTPEVFAAQPAVAELARILGSRKSMLRVSVTASDAGPDIEISGCRAPERADFVTLAELARQHGIARLSVLGETVVERVPPAQRFGAAVVTPPAGAFLQATQDGEAALLADVRAAVGKARRVVDLFAGCGTFSLPLADRATVHAVEGAPAMLRALDTGWRHATGLKPVTTETRDLFRNPVLAADLARFDAAVIDPPRAGAKAQTAELARARVPRIAFVSCNPATFARDARLLLDAGYTLGKIRVVDQFLWSAHTELVASFTLS